MVPQQVETEFVSNNGEIEENVRDKLNSVYFKKKQTSNKIDVQKEQPDKKIYSDLLSEDESDDYEPERYSFSKGKGSVLRSSNVD